MQTAAIALIVVCLSAWHADLKLHGIGVIMYCSGSS